MLQLARTYLAKSHHLRHMYLNLNQRRTCSVCCIRRARELAKKRCCAHAKGCQESMLCSCAPPANRACPLCRAHARHPPCRGRSAGARPWRCRRPNRSRTGRAWSVRMPGRTREHCGLAHQPQQFVAEEGEKCMWGCGGLRCMHAPHKKGNYTAPAADLHQMHFP